MSHSIDIPGMPGLTQLHLTAPPMTHLHESLPFLPSPSLHRVQAIIDLSALRHNFCLLAAHVAAVSPHTRPIAVVKADAYGHGLGPCVHALLEASCRAFAVACLEEAISLRAYTQQFSPAQVKPSSDLSPADSAADSLSDSPLDSPSDSLILILGYTQPMTVGLMLEHHLTATVVSLAHAKALSTAAAAMGQQLRVHIALDTGMNRIGLCAHNSQEVERAVQDIKYIQSLPGLDVEGLFTHFATADEDYDQEMSCGSHTMTQYARYAEVLARLEADDCRPRLCHVCNSATSVRFPTHPEADIHAACLDGVRFGINLYGYGVPMEGLRPVMRLQTSITHLHTLLPGERVGYGGLYSATEPRLIATLPIGYADGWIRALRGAQVEIHTLDGGCYKAPIVGRICMDQCMLDVTGLPVHVDDTVLLFGQRPEQLEALAAQASTITYELLCLVSARVPRVIQH